MMSPLWELLLLIAAEPSVAIVQIFNVNGPDVMQPRHAHLFWPAPRRPAPWRRSGPAGPARRWRRRTAPAAQTGRAASGPVPAGATVSGEKNK
jgi:hypothetical protein